MDFWHTYKGVIQSGLMVACLWAGIVLIIVGSKKQSDRMREIGRYLIFFAAGMGFSAFFSLIA